MSIVNNFLADYISPVFIETGSFRGDGIKQALDAGFANIYSIEASEELWKFCVNRFKDYPNVVCIHGDSRKALNGVINISDRSTIFLDAHQCGDINIGKNKVLTYQNECPLIEELIQLKTAKYKNHTILIDDWKVFGSKIVLGLLRTINKNYKISFRDGNYENDILVATI